MTQLVLQVTYTWALRGRIHADATPALAVPPPEPAAAGLGAAHVGHVRRRAAGGRPRAATRGEGLARGVAGGLPGSRARLHRLGRAPGDARRGARFVPVRRIVAI